MDQDTFIDWLPAILAFFVPTIIFVEIAIKRVICRRRLIYLGTKVDEAMLDSRFSEVIEFCDEILKINPEAHLIYCFRAGAYIGEKDYIAALNDFNKVIELNPELIEAYYGRGIVYIKQGRYADAFNDFNKVIELNPEFTIVYANRGFVYIKQGNYSAAINDYIKTIELYPDNILAYLNLIEILIITNNSDEANKYLERVKMHNPSVQDISVISILNIIYAFANKRDARAELADFKEIIKKEISLNWEFTVLKKWLESPEFKLEDDVKLKIQDVIARYKARQDELKAEKQ